MKLLIAIKSQSNAKKISDTALRLIGRTGYDFKLFVSLKQKRSYLKAIKDANYHWYLAIDSDVIVTKLPPFTYAVGKGYDLILMIDDSFEYWVKDLDREVPSFCRKVGQTRVRFSENPKMKRCKLKQGVTMERVA